MRETQLALGLFLLFLLLQFIIPTVNLPAFEVVDAGTTNQQPFVIDEMPSSDDLVVLTTDEQSPPLPDHPLGTGRETLVEWWNINYDYRRKITIVEPDIASRHMEPVHVYLPFTDGTAREVI